MKTTVKRARRIRRAESRTNWWLVGGIIFIAVGLLFALLFLSLQGEGSAAGEDEQALAEYCQDNPARCQTKGSPDAPVTIVEVSDYSCSHCRDFNLSTAGLLEDLYVNQGQVYYVVLPYALGNATIPAAEAALCAAEQDRYFDFHRRLFEQQKAFSTLLASNFVPLAQELELDMDAFTSCMDGGEKVNTIQSNIEVARAAGVRATPTFFVNGKMLEGNYPLAAFQQEIAAILGVENEG